MSQNQRPALQDSICLRAEKVHLREVAGRMAASGLGQGKEELLLRHWVQDLLPLLHLQHRVGLFYSALKCIVRRGECGLALLRTPSTVMQVKALWRRTLSESSSPLSSLLTTQPEALLLPYLGPFYLSTSPPDPQHLLMSLSSA